MKRCNIVFAVPISLQDLDVDNPVLEKYTREKYFCLFISYFFLTILLSHVIRKKMKEYTVSDFK